ncbi:MAG: hypothetical protein WBN36_03160 [Gammaproteobacteria bacterium]
MPHSLRCFTIRCWKMQQPLAMPDTNNRHPLEIVTVPNAKWRMDDFPQEGLMNSGTTRRRLVRNAG